jgi:signal peptidase II
MSPKARMFWPLLLILVATDCTTKEVAVDKLQPLHTPHEVVGSVIRFTLAHNPDAAFGFDLDPYLGSWARPVLIAAIIAILLTLLRMYVTTAPRARLAAAGLALACGGAIGNLIDRFRFPAGVVDFIDVGIGANRFWIFNVADVGVAIGTVLIGLALIREERAQAARQTPAA